MSKAIIPFFSHTREFEAHRKEFLQAVEGCLRSPSLILGENVRTFEELFAKSCGVPHGIGVANGTDAIALALKALHIGDGDEVITVANTAVPTAAAIRMTGAMPVFVDIDPLTLLMDVSKVEALLTPKTKAILPVHLFGNPVPMQEILAIAKKKKLAVIEDCAQAYGATIEGKPVGSFGDIACFSFYPTKNLGGWGDGGMCITKNAELASRIKSLRMYGYGKERIAEREGVNSRLDELQAAILLVKMHHFSEDFARKRAIALRYDAALQKSSLQSLHTTKNAEHGYHLYVVKAKDLSSTLRQFQEKGIAPLIHYEYPIHLMPAYKFLGFKKGSLPVTEEAAEHILSIPLYPYLTDEEVERVCECLRTS